MKLWTSRVKSRRYGANFKYFQRMLPTKYALKTHLWLVERVSGNTPKRVCENRGPANYNVADGMSGDTEVRVLALRTLRCSKYLGRKSEK